jgi:hypothetical protein
MTPEGKVKKGVRDLLARYQNLYQFWPVQMGYGRTSLDVIGSYKGRFFAVEVKVAGQKPTARQLQTIAEMRASGADVFVVTGEGALPLSALKAWLDAQ